MIVDGQVLTMTMGDSESITAKEKRVIPVPTVVLLSLV